MGAQPRPMMARPTQAAVPPRGSASASTPTRAMPMVATLPKEVPVNSAVSPLRTKARGTRIFGEISFMP